MLIYIPVVAALAIKLFLLYQYRTSWITSAVSKTFLGLLVLQTIASVIEIASLYYGSSPTLPFFQHCCLRSTMLPYFGY